jgi:hypothetical protein
MRNYKPIYQRVIEAAAIAASLMLCSGNVAFANSSLTLEAEDASTNQNVFNDSSASAGQAVDWARSGTLDWQVNAPSAGYYTINIGYALANGSRWLNVEVNGSDTKRVDFPNTGNWGNYANKTVTVRLSVGQNTVSLVKSNGTGPNIDNLKMSSAPSDWIKCADEGQTCNGISNSLVGGTIRYGVPGKWAYRYGVQVSSSTGFACNNVLSEFGDPAPGQVKACYISDELYPSRKLLLRLEAEDASTNQNVFNDSSASLGKAVDWARSGTLDWQVNAPSAGNYTINIGYALANGSRWLNVEVNGSDTKRVDFPSTGNWRNYADKSVTIRLSAGQNTVSLVKSNGSGPNIDNLKMIPEPSIDSNLRNVNLRNVYLRYPTSIQTLHTVHNDSDEEFLASTLTEGESLESPDGNSRLVMQTDGNLVIYSGGQANWSSGTWDNYASSYTFTFHVMANGIEVRRNNTVVWSARPANVSNDTNYLLSLDNDGTLTLNDLEENRVRWRVSGSTAQFRTDVISDSTIENLYAKAGWYHTADWDNSDHEAFKRLHRDLSFWNAHEFYQHISKSLSKVGAGVVDAWDEMVEFEKKAGVAVHQEMTKGVQKILENNTPKQLTEFATGVSQLVGALHDGSLDIRSLFEDEMDKLVDGTMLEDEHAQIIDALDTVTLASGRRLEETTITCQHYGSFCNWLSQPQNKNSRIDYALEADPTAVMEMFKAGNFLNVSAGWVDQVQFRVFFTHPRINGEDRYANEIRIRLMDYAGYFGSGGLKSSYGSLNGTGTAGLVGVRDIILPYTWKKTSTFWTGAKFEGVKYQALTGVIAEGAVDAKLNFSEITKGSAAKTAQFITAITTIPEASEIEMVLQQTAGDVISNVTGAGAEETVETILSAVEELPDQFKSNLGVEGGMGFSPSVFVYDLNEMVDLGKTKNWPNAINNPVVKMFQIILTEAMGAIALPAAGFLFPINEAAIVDDWAAGLSLVNAEFMLGGLIGDYIYFGLHSAIYGKNEGIWLGAEAFYWGAAKAGWAFDAPSFVTKAVEKYGTSGHTSGIPVKFRIQINGSWWDKEWFQSGNPRLKSYGSFEFKTRHDKCVYADPAQYWDTAYASQRTCVDDEASDEGRYRWMAKPFGKEDDNIYQIRSKNNGSQCLAIDSSAYYGDEPSVANGTEVSIRSCITSSSSHKNPKADRWKFRRLGRKTTFTSVLDPTKCLSLAGGNPDDDTKIQLWTCDLKDENQLFTQKYTTGIIGSTWTNGIGSGGSHTIRTHNGQSCIGNVSRSSQPSTGTHAELQDCDPYLPFSNASQTYYFVNLNDGYYKILMSDTHPSVIQSDRKYLDVSGNSKINGAIVQFMTGTNGENQEWKPILQSDGSVKLHARHSGKCLQHGKDGILEQHTCRTRGDANQRFVIHVISYGRNEGYN